MSDYKNLVGLGSTAHAKTEREEHDYYATNPVAMEQLLERESFSPVVWECAVGGGHLAKVLQEHGYDVICSDLVDRGYPNTVTMDFLEYHTEQAKDVDIITNPPYKCGAAFVRKALSVVQDGHKVAFFLRLLFLESAERKKLFEEYPPKTIYVFSKRVMCAKGGNFESYASSSIAYAWFVWEKGYRGETIIKWI